MSNEQDKLWVDSQLAKVRAAHPPLPSSEDRVPFNPKYYDTTMPPQADSFYIEELFAEHGPSQYIPGPVLDWAVQVMRTTYDHTEPGPSRPEAKRTREMVDRKVYHTRGVVQATMDIINGTPGEWNIPQAMTIALSHDIARFPQALLTSTFADYRSFFHAPKSAEMLRNAGIRLADYGIDEAVVMQAIERHGLFDPKTDDPYALLIRDADKLDLLRISDRLLRDSKTYIEGGHTGVSEVMRGAFIKGKMGLNEHRKTEADGILSRMCWVYDINYLETKRLIIKEELLDNLFDQYTKLVGFDLKVYNQKEKWKRSVLSGKESRTPDRSTETVIE